MIKPNYLSTDKDIKEVIQGSKFIRQLMQAPALKEMIKEEVKLGFNVNDYVAMLSYFRENSGSIYHLCGSCRMGSDCGTSVVVKRLCVHGVQGLRIVDALIFPNITSGNINAPAMMVAEKASDMLLEDNLSTKNIKKSKI